MASLVIAEHDNHSLKPATLNTVTAAIACGGDVHVLVAGKDAGAVATAAAQITGVSKVWHAEADVFAHGLAEHMAAQVLALASGYSHILFAATAEEQTSKGPKKKITGFLVDFDTPGCERVAGYDCVSNAGYHNMIINFDNCRIPNSKVLGEVHGGFDVANTWLGATRLQVAAVCVGRARRALNLATEWAATREQFGQQIGKFQGVSFKLADMKTQLDAAELLTLRAAWNDANGKFDDSEIAMAKVFATEMCQFVTDEAIQIFGGMGLMTELPLERMWRDTRVDRIWDGTSEIQRHIISRGLLREFGG